MMDLEDEKARILEQLAEMAADTTVKPELRLKAAGMVLGHERGTAAPAKDEGETEPEVLRFDYPHNYYVDLSEKLLKIKLDLLNAGGKSQG